MDPIVFIALKRICGHLVDEVWKTSVGSGEVAAEFELAKERTKRYKEDVIKLSKVDTNLNWGQIKKQTKNDKYIISKEEDFNPWYKGELTLEEFLDSLKLIVDFLGSTNRYIQEAEFIHYYHFLKNGGNFLCKDISDDFWILIHDDIKRVSQRKFILGMYAESVRSAWVELEDKVRKLVKEKTGKELSGSTLMREAFSVNDPIIVLADVSTKEGRDIQQGFMEIFAGSMVGVRNPKSHRNFEISKRRAIHFLFLGSLLMNKLTESDIMSDYV